VNGSIWFTKQVLCGWREIEQIERHTFEESVSAGIIWDPNTPVLVVETHVFERKNEPFGPAVVRLLTPHGLFWSYATEICR
jgi:hypothetical protein